MIEEPTLGAVMDVDLTELTVDRTKPLGEGGAAEIFRCTTPSGAQRILKLYNADVLKRIDVDALHHLIALPQSLSTDEQVRLSRLCAWPEAVVTKHSKLVGILMPEAPPRFFTHRNGALEPRHFSRLAVREERAAKGGYPYYDFPQKIARLGKLLAALEFLHSLDIVIGDLQWNNVLTTGTESYSGETSSEVYLLDCDSFIVRGQAPLTNMDPMSWKPPYPTKGFSPSTDMFKFALMVIRCLSEQTNQESIDYSRYTGLMPSSDFNKLHLLLTKPNPGLTAGDLGALARAWQASVNRDGRMYRRTDTVAREPWTAAMRKAHLAGAPQAPTSRKIPKRGATTRPTTPYHAPVPPYRPPVLPPLPEPARPGLSAGKILMIIGAILFFIWVLIKIAESSNSSASGSSSTWPSTASTTSTSVNAIRTASVGDCIHIDVIGETDGGATQDVNVRQAECGSDYATDRVTAVVSSVDSCGYNWVRSSDSTPAVVLCLHSL